MSWASERRAWLRSGAAASVAVWAGGCAVPPAPPPAAVAVPAEPAAESAAPSLEPRTLRYLAERNLEPITGRPINVRAQCSFRDPNGYRGRLQLDVREASVHSFEAEVSVPGRGTCRFALKDFHQTAARPIVTLASGDGGCVVRIWEEPRQITVAFSDCPRQCEGNARDYLWPILVDVRTGDCS